MRKNNKFWKWTPSREFNFRFMFYVSFSSISKPRVSRHGRDSHCHGWKPFCWRAIAKKILTRESGQLCTTRKDPSWSIFTLPTVQRERQICRPSLHSVFSPLGLWSHFVRLFQVVEVSAQFQKSFSAFLLFSCGDVSLSTVAFNYQQPSCGDWRWFVLFWCCHWQLDFLLKFTFYLFKN